MTAAFSGGTSLSTAWQLISRFSEDIDFKVAVTAPSKNAEINLRKRYRDEVIRQLTGAGFVLDGELMARNKSQFIHASFHYGPIFPKAAALRPTLQVEMTFSGTYLPPEPRPVTSLVSRFLKRPPEIGTLLCVAPLETPADKLSALAWRTAARDRTSPDDDPTIIRHLHDLAALEPKVEDDEELRSLTRRLLALDAKRAGVAGTDGLGLLRFMLPKMVGDQLWQREYEQFVDAVSFGPDSERISYGQALEACGRLVERASKP